MIEIHEMTFVDAWSLLEVDGLFEAQFKETEDSEKFDFDVDTELFEMMDDQGKLQCFVAMNDDAPVGYYVVSMTSHPHKDVVTSREEAIYVKPEFRGQGLCTEMYSRVEDFLRDQGVEIFFMTIKAGQPDTLVTRLGFTEEETAYKKYL